MSGAPTSTDPNPTQVRRLAGEFVKEYYRTLNANPDNLATFYHEDSSYSRLDEAGQDCVAATVVGQAKIGAKIKANGFRIPAIDSVDFQASANGAVVLMVQGTVEITSEQAQRKFAQTFVLLPATDALGLQLYYVRNDILHLLQSVNLVEQTPQVILQPVPTQQPAEPAVETKTPAPQAQAQAASSTTAGSGSPARPKKEKKSSRPKPGQQQQQQQPADNKAASADNATTAAAPATETKAAPASDKPAETATPTALPKRDNTARKQRPRSQGKKPGDGNAAAPADNTPAAEPAANKAPVKVSSWASLAGGSATPSATTTTTGSVAAQPKRPARAKKATIQAPATESEQKDAAAGNTSGGETKKDNSNANANTAAGSPRPSTAGGKGHSQGQGPNQPQTPRANGQSVEKRPFIFVKDLGGAQKKDLEDLFKPFGTVTMVSLPPKRHYALVYFADATARDKVLAQPSFRVKDHEISVEMGRPSKPDHSGRQQNQGQQGGEHRRAKSTSSNRGAPRARPPRSFVAGSGVVGDNAANGGGHNRQPSKAANGPKTALGSPTNKNFATNAGNNA